MKQLMKVMAFTMMALMTTAGFVACGDDDENKDNGRPERPERPDGGPEDGQEGGQNGGPESGQEGERVLVTAITGTTYTYNDNGTLKSFTVDNEEYVFNGSVLNIEDEEGAMTFTLSNNLVSKVTLKFSGLDDEGQKENYNYTINYNYSNNQLTSCKVSMTGDYIIEGTKITYSGNTNVKYTWSNGNLTKCVADVSTTYKYAGQSLGYKSKDNYTISYGNQSNKYKQFPYYMAEELTSLDNVGGILGVAGGFGMGPSSLPKLITDEWSEESDFSDPDSGTEEYEMSFSLNNNGAISIEKMVGESSINYTYDNRTRAAIQNALPTLKNMKKKIVKRINFKK